MRYLSANASAAVPAAGRDRMFIELLVFAVAQSAVFFADSSERGSTEHVFASLLILAFWIFGLPAIRNGGYGAIGAALLDLAILGTLASIHTPTSALIFIVVASAFRNGISLSRQLWSFFVSADVLVLVANLVFMTHHGANHPRGWVFETLGYAGVALTLVLAAIRHANSARNAYEALSVAHAELRRHVNRVGELAALQERERIALDIHDALGHELTSLAMQLEVARCLIGTDEQVTEAYLSQAHATSLRILADVRRSVREISGDPLEREFLDVALRRVCDRFEHASAIELTFDAEQLPKLPASTTTHAVNIVREALTNIARHAEARSIGVNVTSTANEITIVVQDDGRGFEPGYNEAGHGVRGMRSRAHAIGAAIDIQSRPGAGCRIRFALPIVAEMVGA